MISYCFGLYDQETLIGACIFGKMAMANAWKAYAQNPGDVIELRRLCLIDNTKKFAETYFIGRCLRWLKKNTEIKTVISYADPEYGHQGTIYKASNFSLIGRTSRGKVIYWQGKKYHDKAIRTKYKGELKPFAQRIKDALLSGEAVYKKTEGKFIYLKLIRS